jgi:quercetin dioxygenase-like cupin family protein
VRSDTNAKVRGPGIDAGIPRAVESTARTRREEIVEPRTSRARIDFESDVRFARLGRELGVEAFGLNVITLTPGQRLRIHRHAAQEEVYVVLRGTLTLSIEGEETAVAVGEVFFAAPEVRRQLANRDPAERLVLLAIGGHGEHLSRDAEAFTSWDELSGRPPADVPLPPDLEL